MITINWVEELEFLTENVLRIELLLRQDLDLHLPNYRYGVFQFL